MSGTFTAQLADNGGWHLYVALLNTWEVWPERAWPQGAPTPTLTERGQVLACLGYEVEPGGEWEWCESSDILDDPASPVRLIATVTVRPVPEVTA